MKIIVWGMGYVGTVSAANLALNGNNVIGIDPDHYKINNSKSPINETGLTSLINKVVSAGRLKGICD